MSNLSVTLIEVLRRVLESRLLDVHTSFPAKVIAYHANTQTADLAPQVRRPVPTDDDDVGFEDLPILSGVRIQFPRGSGDTIAITWPLSAGDFVNVHVETYSTNNWRATGEVSDPGDVRLHGLSSCYAVPGASHSALVLAQATINALVLEAPEIRAGKNASDFAGLASLIDANFNAVKVALAGASPPIALTLPHPSVASSKLKVE